MTAPPSPCRRRAGRVLLGLGWLTSLGRAAAAEPLRVVTEELPPYNMTRNGRVTGLCTEIVEAVMQQVGVRAAIESMPWERAYETALNGENVLIYSIDRTPHRETLFKWVGEIGPPDREVLYARAARHLRIKTLDDARRYQIGTIHGDSTENYLLSKGFEIGKNLVRSNRYESSYELLKLGRIDLWASSTVSGPYIVRDAGDDPGTAVAVAYEFDATYSRPGVMLAFGLHTPDALVQRFRDGLTAIQRNGRFEAIQRRWR